MEQLDRLLSFRVRLGAMKRVASIALLCLLSVSYSHAQQTAAEHDNLGYKLASKGDPDGAIAEFRAALALDPSDVYAHSSLAVTLQKKGDLPGAVNEYRTALRLKPNDAVTHGNLGDVLRVRGDMEEAVAEFQTALRLKPDFVEVRNDLGKAYQDRLELEKAIVEYRAAIRMKPDFAEAHYNLAFALDDDLLNPHPDINEAMAEYRTALRLAPDFEVYTQKAHYGLGIRLREKGDLAGAIAELKTAVALDPNHAGAHNHLGIALSANGNLDEAIVEWRAALRIKPDMSMPPYRGIAMALVSKGDMAGAMTELQALLHLYPDDADALNTAAWIYATATEPALHDPAKAVKYARHAVAVDKGEHATYLGILGTAYYANADYHNAVLTVKKALTLKADESIRKLLAESLAEYEAAEKQAAR